MFKTSNPPPTVNPIDLKDNNIRQHFKNPLSPFHYLTYQQFLKNFPTNENNFKRQNLNIIDIHLRYRIYIRQKMAPYKWLPILCLTPIIYHNFWLVMIIPYFTVSMFDHYFERLFAWRHRNDRIINVRSEFVSKLSKQKNKLRRISLFQKLKDKLERKDQTQEGIQPPLKYIKFGDFSQYLLHSNVGGTEQSSVLQTTLFDTYLNLKTFFVGLSQLSIIYDVLKDFKDTFVQFKKSKDRNTYLLNLKPLLQRQDIKQSQIYTLQDNMQNTIRRFIELYNYTLFNKLQPSTFRIWQYTNASKYQDIFDPIRYNIKDNSSDLLIYYAIFGIPKLMKIIFKRR